MQQDHFMDSEDVVEIVISDSATPVQRHESYKSIQDEESRQVVELVKPRYLGEDQELIKKQSKIIKNAVEKMKELQVDETQKQMMNDLIKKQKNKTIGLKAERELRRQFEKHSYLSVEALENVKKLLLKFDSVCRMEEIHHKERNFAKIKQQNRRLLTKVLLLAIEQLRQKVNRHELTDSEKDLVDRALHPMPFCYQISSEIQNEFFARLARKPGKSELYQKRIKLVLREFSDKNNIEFRRNIMARSIDLEKLSKIPEEDLKCEKTKQEDLARMQQLIRESEKDPFGINQPQSESSNGEVVYTQLNTFPSVMDVQRPRESEQEVRQRETRELTLRCLEQYRCCSQQMKSYRKQREQRVQKLKNDHKDSLLFMNLCDKMDI